MAAAALSRRGVAGVRTTKGLFFIVTLLSLVCVGSSLIDKDKLEKLKRTHQEAQEKLNMLKVEKASYRLSCEYLKLVDPMIELVKQASLDFLPLEEFLECTKNFVDKVKTYLDEHNEELGAEIQKHEEQLRKMKELIKSLEEHQAEL